MSRTIFQGQNSRHRDSGVISAADMTTEAAVTKLMWVLGHTHDMDKVRQMMAWDYCGEINADRVM